MQQDRGVGRGRAAQSEAEQRYIGIAELRAIIPVSDMCIWRWQRDPTVGFPAPVKLGRNGRRFWWLPKIREWQAKRAGEGGVTGPPLGSSTACPDHTLLRKARQGFPSTTSEESSL
jgi:predicted DNA-binding transcriptional regulator AlpA